MFEWRSSILLITGLLKPYGFMSAHAGQQHRGFIWTCRACSPAAGHL